MFSIVLHVYMKRGAQLVPLHKPPPCRSFSGNAYHMHIVLQNIFVD